MASTAPDQVRCQTAPNNTTKTGTLTPKWRQYLKRIIPSSKNDPKDRIMKSTPPQDENHTEKPFRFLDLPPEQRNQIYKYCLVPPRRIKCASEHKGPTQTPVSCVDSWYRMLMNIHYFPFNPHILRTCRVIHREATAMLYGLNKFYIGSRHLDQAHLTWTILAPTHGPIKRIRHLELGPRTRKGEVAVHPVLARVQNAVSLETLKIDFTWVDCFKTPDSMAKAMLLLKNQLNRAKRQDGMQELDIRFLSINMRTRTWVDRRFEDKWDLSPGCKKDVAIFVPAFKKALKRMVTEEQTKKIRGKKKKV
ncbi:unnamed protein product [Zymoseptoria tritici ST99CH_1E4]|uniref:2EXR domain-containing protein n=1 Tax=Zymoseptoria tritici ST99CH_1E4 TaxID=1276532 RepID=A0A2H1GG67_ZYMTR|nr:unnamed protein product [Zymoseptoria tritici ST99CH_1E4]